MHTYIHTYLHTYILTYLHTYIHTYINTYTHTYIHIHIHTYLHTYIHTYMHLHTYIHTHIYIHTYIYVYAYIHTYIHTCIHSSEYWILRILKISENTRSLRIYKNKLTNFIFAVFTEHHTQIHSIIIIMSKTQNANLRNYLPGLFVIAHICNVIYSDKAEE